MAVLPPFQQPCELLAVVSGLKKVCSRVVSTTAELASLRNFAVEKGLRVVCGEGNYRELPFADPPFGGIRVSFIGL